MDVQIDIKDMYTDIIDIQIDITDVQKIITDIQIDTIDIQIYIIFIFAAGCETIENKKLVSLIPLLQYRSLCTDLPD